MNIWPYDTIPGMAKRKSKPKKKGSLLPHFAKSNPNSSVAFQLIYPHLIEFLKYYRLVFIKMKQRLATLSGFLLAFFKIVPVKKKTIQITKQTATIYNHQTLFDILLVTLKKIFAITFKVQSQFIKFSKKIKKSRSQLHFRVSWSQLNIFSALRSYPWRTFFSFSLTLLIIIGSYMTYDLIFKDLPQASDLTKLDQKVSTKILDRKGRLLYNMYKDENRTIVPLSQISDSMIKATVAIEDQKFYKHHGFSVSGIIRSAIANLKGESIQQGGSTITQQLVKNTLLTPEQTLKRKLREVVLAIVVDGTYSKDQILEMYFNEIPYGGSTYGVEEAAQRYFGKHAQDLTLAESAMLAGLPAAPSVYTPFGSNPELAYARQAEVLRRMVEDEYITTQEAEAARQEKLNFIQDRTDILAPHFVMYIRGILANLYGEDVINQGGLEVRTTLDLDIQKQAEAAVQTEITKLKNLHVTNGAAMVTNPQTGEILAMVGSVNYFDFEHDGQVNVAIRPRQPGSSIKPITYATAFEMGKLTPTSIIQDSPITYQMVGSPPYSPKNYDGKFHGNVTAREALASSYNVPAVKTLASIGINNMIDKAMSMGITTWNDRKRFGLSLTLGGGEVLMTDMTQVYGTFANGGTTVALNPIMYVRNYKHEVLYYNSCAVNQEKCPGNQTLSTATAYQITNILSDNVARTPAFGPQSVLNIPGQQVAVKTGTTNNLRDNWTIGYTNDRLVATWVGNNDNTPMSYVASGITGASPIWNEIMRGLLSEDTPSTLKTPDNLIKVKICATTGTLPCASCPKIVEEVFEVGKEPTKACTPEMFVPSPSPSPNIQRGRGQIL